jgi:hypothetical protein
MRGEYTSSVRATAEIALILDIFLARRNIASSMRNCAFPTFDSHPPRRIVAQS